MAKSIYKGKRLRERVCEIIEFAKTDKQFMNEIQQKSGIDRSNILKYLNAKQNMRLHNIGKLIHASHHYFEKTISDKNHIVFQQVDLKNISEGLYKIEYERLGVYSAKHLYHVLIADLEISDKHLPLLNFDMYIDDLINDWENSLVAKLYIPLTASTPHEKDVEVDVFLQNWLSQKNEIFMFVLGQLGTTTVLKHFAYDIAKAFQANSLERIPVIVPLGRFLSHKSDIKNILTAYFIEALNINLVNGYKDIELLISQGKLLFIIDGFDETIKTKTNNDIIRSVYELSKIIHSENKIIISAKGNFFTTNFIKNNSHLDDMFTYLKLGKLLDINNQLSLNPFSQSDIDLYILKFCEEYKTQNGITSDNRELSENIKQLVDLKKNCHPMSVLVTFTVLPKVFKEKALNQTIIFETFVDSYAFKKKDYSMFYQEFRLFAEELAWYLWTHQTTHVDHSIFDSHILKQFASQQGSLITVQFLYEIRNSIIWNEDVSGRYFFVYDNFYYYFTACAFVKRIKIVNEQYLNPKKTVDYITIKQMGDALIGDEIMNFLIHMDFNCNELFEISDFFDKLGKRLLRNSYLGHNINAIINRINAGEQYAEYVFIKKIKNHADFYFDKKLQKIAHQTMEKLHNNANLTPTQVFQAYLELCIQPKIQSLNCSLEQLVIMFDTIAFYLFINDKEVITPKTLFSDIINLFNPINSNSDINTLKEFIVSFDFMDCSHNTVKFSHINILNYLVAHNLFRKIENRCLDDIGEKVLPIDIIDHLINMNISEKILTDNFERFMLSTEIETSAPYVGTNLLMILRHIGIDISVLPLAGLQFPSISLEMVELLKCNLSESNFSEANLNCAILIESNLSKAVLTNAKLENAVLTGANLQAANLKYANLKGAYLSRTNLSNADLTGADLTGALITQSTVLNNATGF